jgi:hypothetical protein
MSFEADTTEEHEMRIVRCSSCRARIIWLKTERGKNMPVDADTVDPEDDIFDPEVHTSHFATCPNANQHRKPRQ